MKNIITKIFSLVFMSLIVISCASMEQSELRRKQSLSVTQGMSKQQVLSIMGDSPTTREVRGSQEVWRYSTPFANWATLEDGYTHQIYTFLSGRLAAINYDKTFTSTSYKDCWIYEPRGNRPDAIFEIRHR
jgi:hypothetical protein